MTGRRRRAAQPISEPVVTSVEITGPSTLRPGRTVDGNIVGVLGQVRRVHPDVVLTGDGPEAVLTWTASDDGTLPVEERDAGGELTHSWPDGVAVHQETARVGDHVVELASGGFRAIPAAG